MTNPYEGATPTPDGTPEMTFEYAGRPHRILSRAGQLTAYVLVQAHVGETLAGLAHRTRIEGLWVVTFDNKAGTRVMVRDGTVIPYL